MSNRSVPPATEERLAFNKMWDQSNPSLAYHIYLLRDEDNGCLYVGVTTELKKRVYNHWQRQAWAKDIAKVEVLEIIQGRYAALLAERVAIQAFKPKYNVVHTKAIKRKKVKSLPPKKKEKTNNSEKTKRKKYETAGFSRLRANIRRGEDHYLSLKE